MLIRLIPNPPHPTVLFELVFNDLPEGLPTPSAWIEQLNMLNMDDLELPELLHCLDKSSLIPSLLDEVEFNVINLTITCRFIDGAVEEWPLTVVKCLQFLESVALDVSESSREAEREKERERISREALDEKEKNAELLNSPRSPAVKVTTRHKKQRSLLMSLVASIIPMPSSPFSRSSSRSSSRPSSPLMPAELTPIALPIQTILPSPPPALSPVALRHRARSTLVETFRLYVQPELKSRMSINSYYMWAVKSMLRRLTALMSQLVQNVDTRMQPVNFSSLRDTNFRAPSSPSSLGPFYSDEDTEVDTDTDWSSVHTPSNHQTGDSFYFEPAASEDAPSTSDSDLPGHVKDKMTNDECSKYRELSIVTMRMRHLLVLAGARETRAETDNNEREHVLAVRSRRRAWLNKCLIHGAPRCTLDVGLSTPFHRSPLGLGCWTREDLESTDGDSQLEYSTEDYDLYHNLLHSREDANSAAFPVSEMSDDEDEGEFKTQSGTHTLDHGDAMYEISALMEGMEISSLSVMPWLRPRPRTSSLRSPVDTPLPVDVASLHQKHTCPCDDQPPEYSPFDTVVSSSEGCRIFDNSNDFMDVPLTAISRSIITA